MRTVILSRLRLLGGRWGLIEPNEYQPLNETRRIGSLIRSVLKTST